MGIHLFGEISFTSGWAQAVDQWAQNLKGQYKKARNLFKRQRSTPGNPYTLTDADFVEILLDIWNSGWAMKADIQRSFERTGIQQQRLAPEMINREAAGFTLPPPSPEGARIGDTDTPSPRCYRRGSLAYYKEKTRILVEHIEKLRGSQLLPSETGMLDVPVASKKRKQNQIAKGNLQTGGSYVHGELARLNEEKRGEKAKADGEKEERRAARAERKAEHNAEKKKLEDGFWACRRVLDKSRGNGTGRRRCLCGEDTCKYAKFHHCSHCGDIKTMLCRKTECKAKYDAAQTAEA